MGSPSFYDPSPEQTLRFGDIIRGYPSVFAVIDVGSTPFHNKGVSVIVDHQAYGMVVNPCCSIRDEKLSIAMLKPVSKNYFKVPALKENLIKLNNQMHAREAIPPAQWDRLSPEDRATREASGPCWVFNTAFILAPHPLLPEYEIEIGSQKVKCGYYEIDFRECTLIMSKKIQKPELPVDNIEKILQLSITNRNHLRQKLLAYFQRSVD